MESTTRAGASSRGETVVSNAAVDVPGLVAPSDSGREDTSESSRATARGLELRRRKAARLAR